MKLFRKIKTNNNSHFYNHNNRLDLANNHSVLTNLTKTNNRNNKIKIKMIWITQKSNNKKMNNWFPYNRLFKNSNSKMKKIFKKQNLTNRKSKTKNKTFWRKLKIFHLNFNKFRFYLKKFNSSKIKT